jgi:FAD:protein FMN transferase
VATAGTVDPTVGAAMVDLGYDRDFTMVAGGVHSKEEMGRPAPGWWTIRLDPERRTVSIPDGVRLDVGATAKAYAADRCARRIADAVGGGVLLNLGGDLSVAGETPPGGWAVGIAPTCTVATSQVDQVVAISGGGLATSGTTARAWLRNGRPVHHIVDPATGSPADPVWSLVSTTASSCVEANGWSTAAVVWGEDAVGNLSAEGVPARLVRTGGEVVVIGGWPDEAGGPPRTVTDLGAGPPTDACLAIR